MKRTDLASFIGLVPVPEKELRDFGKKIGNIFGASGDHELELENTKWVGELLRTLLDTVSCPSLSVSHQVASVNALCGCIEQCIDASEDDLVNLICSLEIHDELYLIYTARLDGTRMKCLKQLLGTFVRLLAKSAAVLGSTERIDGTCLAFLDVLCHGRDRPKVKPALLALTLFVSRGLLDSWTLADVFGRCRDGISHGTRNSYESLSNFQALLNLILDWVSVSDLGPAAGNLLSTLLSTNRKSTILPGESPQSVFQLPIWVQPIMRALHDNLQALQGFRNYAFPALFQANHCDYWHFLLFLGVEDLFITSNRVPQNVRGTLFPSDLKQTVLFVALQTGKAAGIVKEFDNSVSKSVTFEDGTVWISVKTLERLCYCSSIDAQLAGLFLMVSTPNSTQPLCLGSLHQLRKCFPIFHAAVDSSIRGEVHSLTQALLNRLRTVTANIAHKIKMQEKLVSSAWRQPITVDIKSTSSLELLRTSLKDHENFLHWFIDFLIGELCATASYQRHICALKALLGVVKSGLDPSVDERSLSKQAKNDPPWPFGLKVFTELLRRSLYDLLLDAFDDVRQTSLELLKVSSAGICGKELQEQKIYNLPLQFSKALGRAETAMITSGRVDHADGVARFYDLLGALALKYDLPDIGFQHKDSKSSSKLDVLDHLIRAIEQSLMVARISMHDAVGQHSIHGLYTALRYVLEEIPLSQSACLDKSSLNPFLVRISDSFMETWHTVHYLLCNDAPEGFVPEDMEEEPELTTKDALSYAWRALKESSLVLRCFVSHNFLEVETTTSPISALSLRHLGDLCFTQLAELRHRGAFSTVAQTFAVVCHHCSLSSDANSQILIETWYERTLTLIAQRGSMITRRSAGIPAIMSSLLSAQPTGPLFGKAITDLQSLSKLSPKRQESDGVTDLPQVHALNSMRAIFTTSKLGSQSEQYVGVVMKVAADCLNSDIWAIRNCGLMLFRSLIDRLLGSDESYNASSGGAFDNGSRMSYGNQPGLLELLIRLLARAQEPDLHDTSTALSTEAIFPVLDLLRRAPPPEHQRPAIGEQVLKVTSNVNWHIRDMAARTFTAFTSPDAVLGTVDLLLSTRNPSHNQLHGRMLCVKYLIQNAVQSLNVDQVQQFMLAIDARMRLLLDGTLTRISLATYMDILNEFGFRIILWPETDTASAGFKSLVGQHTATVAHLREIVAKSFYFGPLDALLSQAMISSLWLTKLIHATSPTVGERATGVYNIDGQDFVDLLQNDPCATIENLKTLCDRLSTASQDVLQAFMQILAGLLGASISATIMPAVQSSFTDVFCKISQPLQHVDDSTFFSSLARLDPMWDLSLDQSPSDFESSLAIWGCALNSKYRVHGSWTDPLFKEAQLWLQYVQAALDEQNDFPLRFAAALSLRTFSISCSVYQPLPTSLQTAYIFAVYDTLNDDDEEIRTLGASVVPKIVEAAGLNGMNDLGFTPPIAAQMLCSYLVRVFGDSASTITESIDRLVGQQGSRATSLVPSITILHAAMNKETVLFDEEKPNLYIDPVKEADTWSRVLKHTSLVNLPQQTINNFSTWVVEGLDSLISTTRSQVDGPLGWTSKPDVFALGMRVLCATDALLELRTKSRKVKVRGSLLRMKLREFADAGTEMDLHGLWMKKIENVLSRSVEKRLGRVRDVLASLPVSVC